MTGLDEIQGKYAAMGCPSLLISKEQSRVCAGGWMGERLEAIHGKAALIEPLWKELGYPGTVA
jgi:hypothetical protein